MRARFTLTEMVIVLFIIGLLSTLVFASASYGMEAASKIECMGNLRNISNELQAFPLSHRGRSMPASFDDTVDGGFNHWQNYMISKGVSPEVFLCPSMPSDEYFDPAGHAPDEGNIYKEGSYIMNIIRPGQWGGSDISYDVKRASGWALDSKSPVMMSDVYYPERAIYILDAAGGLHHNHSGVNKFSRTDHGQEAIPAVGDVRWVGSHHGAGGFNVLFGDGHCEFLTETEADQWVVTEKTN